MKAVYEAVAEYAGTWLVIDTRWILAIDGLVSRSQRIEESLRCIVTIEGPLLFGSFGHQNAERRHFRRRRVDVIVGRRVLHFAIQDYP